VPKLSESHKGTVYAKIKNTENRFILYYIFLKTMEGFF